MGRSRASKPIILVVDDDWATRAALRDLFEVELRAEVVEAEDGDDAGYALIDARPDLAVIDARMPWTDGVELVRRMRADPSVGAIPIIGISALDRGKEMLDAGCTAFVQKPFTVEALLAAVRGALPASADT
ncbi:MAG TPA: response regulator [Chloroflexota bacterium]|jgi:CheY-like chemotaxis protein|nr:response regulator [Chloroflexota bacterium]